MAWGDDIEPRVFPRFGVVAIAAIVKLPDTALECERRNKEG
jgi:hypothetical protein